MKKKFENMRIIITILVFTILMVICFVKFNGTSLNDPNKTVHNELLNETAENEPKEKESKKDKAIIEKTKELAYKHSHFNNSWYDMNTYKALGEKVSEDYLDKICFLGDSRTKGLLEFTNLPFYHGFYKIGTTAAAACSQQDYTIDNYYYHNILEIIEKVDYDIYYVGYGTNDLGLGNSDQFISDLRKIIDHIKEYHPDSIIYVENILPMGAQFSISHPLFSNENAEIYNKAIYDMCVSYGDVIYLDIADCMKKEDGSAKDEYIVDGLHYNAEGYKMIINFIRDTVVEKIK